MTRDWTPRDALIGVLMERLYVWAPGEAEAHRIIEATAGEVLQNLREAGYAIVPAEPAIATNSSVQVGDTGPDSGRAH